MREPWLIYLCVFVLVTIAALMLQRSLRDVSVRRRRTQRRFASLGAIPEAGEFALRRQDFLGSARWGVLRRVDRLIVQSGTGLPARSLPIIAAGVAVVVYVLTWSLGGFVLRASVALVTGPIAVWVWLRMKRARRVARFAAQLPDIVDIMVRSLRAGHPLPTSLKLIAREAGEPARSEFSIAVAEVSYGRSVAEALDNLHQRVGYPELRFLVAAASIAHQTGGNLAEILSRLSQMLRERFRLTRRVRALSAEGRFSGFALSALPVALFGLINLVSASYYADFWASEASRPVLAVSLGLLLLGNLLIYRMVNFRV